MPYERPGAGVYVTATKVHFHDEPGTENGLVGTCVKQRANPITDGIANQRRIAISEPFHLRTKGIKEYLTSAGSKGVALAGAAIGSAVYITTADDTLTATAGAGKIPFGRVVEIPGAQGRQVTPNRIRIDLDQKDTLA